MTSGAARAAATDVRTLRDAIRGEIVTSADPSYESARRVWNGLVDRRPLLIAYCQSAEDIATCVRFAREREILIAVRSGGHACAGISVYDDGLVIDTSRMRVVSVDPVRRIARAQAGARWREMDHATQAYGLATPGRHRLRGQHRGTNPLPGTAIDDGCGAAGSAALRDAFAFHARTSRRRSISDRRALRA